MCLDNFPEIIFLSLFFHHKIQLITVSAFPDLMRTSQPQHLQSLLFHSTVYSSILADISRTMVMRMAPDIFDHPVPRFRCWGMSDRLNEELLTSEGSHSSLSKPRLSRPHRKCSQGRMCMLVSEHRGGTVRMAWGRTGNQDEGDIWAWF